LRGGRMSSRGRNLGAHGWRRPLAVAGFVLALVAAAAVAAALSSSTGRSAAPLARGELAQTFSPGESAREGGEGIDEGAQDWTMRSSPATDIPLAVINASRQDWKTLRGRGDLGGEGHWTNLGPDNAVYPLNPFRNRSVYVPNEYVAAGRTAHSVIDPNCNAAKCRYWLANAGGGIWRTDNVLAPEPQWEYVSGSFDYNNTAALALDR